MEIVNIKEACNILGLKDIEDFYEYIYDTISPEMFMDWIFTEIFNNNISYNKRFHSYYLYKIKIALKLPDTDKQFYLYQQNIETIINDYYKLNYLAINNIWINYYNKNEPLIYKEKEVFIQTEKLYEIIQNELASMTGIKHTKKVYLSKILNQLYKKKKYGKFGIVKDELKKMGFRIRNENYTTAYITITKK